MVDTDELTRPGFTRRAFGLDTRRWALLRWRAGTAELPPAVVLCAAFVEVLGCWSASPRFTITLTIPGLGDRTAPIPLACDLTAGHDFAGRAAAVMRQFRAGFEHRRLSDVRADAPFGFTSLLGDFAHLAARTPRAYLDVQVLELVGDLRVHWYAVDEMFPPGLMDDMFAAYERLVRRLADEGAAWATTSGCGASRYGTDRRRPSQRGDRR